MFRTITTALCVTFALMQTAQAQEPTSFDVLLGNGALICDKPESVQLTLGGTRQSDCGIFQTRRGAPVTVTLNGDMVQHPNGNEYPLAAFEFHNPTPWGNQLQFGFWAGDVPEDDGDLEPATMEYDA